MKFHIWLAAVLLATTAPAAETKLRVMAANITSGNNQSYTTGEGTRIFRGLQPDIVLIQEFNFKNNTKAEIAEWVSTTFSPDFQFYREEKANIPNGVVSRYPIIASGEWDDPAVNDRDFAWARIDLPGPRDLWAISVHLLTSGSQKRREQASVLVKFIQQNVRKEDYLIIGGDFNTDGRKEAALQVLSSVVLTGAPYPVDGKGNGNTNANRNKPYDWVLVDDDLDKCKVPTTIGTQTFNSGLVFDSRVFDPLAAVAPVRKTDSGAPQMQHMAVVRDFVIKD